MENKEKRKWKVSDFYYEPTPEEMDEPLTEEAQAEEDEDIAEIEKMWAEADKEKAKENKEKPAK